MMGTSLPQSSCYHHQGTILLSRFLISSNVPELFYELVPENTALDAYSLGADAGWESVGGGVGFEKILQDTKGNSNWECGIYNGNKHLICPPLLRFESKFRSWYRRACKAFPAGQTSLYLFYFSFREQVLYCYCFGNRRFLRSQRPQLQSLINSLLSCAQ